MTLLSALVGYYDRLAEIGAVAEEGSSPENISFALVLDRGGTLVDVQDLRDTSGKKPRPRSVMVPRPPRRTSGIASNVLWDKTAYVLGVSATSKRAPLEHAAFRALHEELLAGADDEGLRSLLAFLRDWRPEMYDGHPAIRRCADDMRDQNVVFRLDGEQRFVHQRPAARAIWAGRAGTGEAGEGEAVRCLVTGEMAPSARLHPAIKGVPGAQSSGASLVSFNLEAFTSYGKEQGANAPVSARAAHAYGTALNALLAAKDGVDDKGRPKWRNRIQIGDLTIVFWAEAPGGPAGAKEAEATERFFGDLLQPPTDDQELARIAPVLRDVEAGRSLAELKPDIDPDTRFFVLGLSPNAARLAVRFFLESTFGEMASRIVGHWRDLRIEPHFWKTPPAVWRLVLETAAQRDSANVSPVLATEFSRAIFTGTPYPRPLLSLTLMRIRADGVVNDLRAALAKACLVREQEDVPVSLDPDETNPGYRLGRLFALLESVQRAALGRNINATIRDKFFGSASASPGRVFPLLLRGAQDHLGAVRKKESGGLSFWFDQRIAEVMGGLSASDPFPATLSLADQGRFAVGYYHQRWAAKAEGHDADDVAELAGTED